MDDYDDDVYNFDITPSREQRGKKKTRRDKEKAQQEKARILMKSKEERMEELLGQIHSQGAAELELERQQQRERVAEEERIRQEELRRKEALARAEDHLRKGIPGRESFSSDSLNTDTTDSASTPKERNLKHMSKALPKAKAATGMVEGRDADESDPLKRYSFADMSELLQQQSVPEESGIPLSPIDQSSPSVCRTDPNDTYENDFVSEEQASSTGRASQPDSGGADNVDTTDTTVLKSPEAVEAETKDSTPQEHVATGTGEDSSITKEGVETNTHVVDSDSPKDTVDETEAVVAAKLPAEGEEMKDVEPAAVEPSVAPTPEVSPEPIKSEERGGSTELSKNLASPNQQKASPVQASKEGSPLNDDKASVKASEVNQPVDIPPNKDELPEDQATEEVAKMEAKKRFWEGMKETSEAAPGSPKGFTPPPPPPETKPAFAYFQTPPPPPPQSLAKAKLTSRKSSKQRESRMQSTIQELKQREDGLLHQVETLQRENGQLLKDVKIAKTQLEQSKAEVYALEAKLREVHGMSSARKKLHALEFGQAQGGVDASELLSLKKEIEAQERLLQGYQRENEKLVLELRAKDQQSLEMKETLYKENKRLGRELNNTPAKPPSNAQALRRKLDVEQQVAQLQEQLEASREKQAELKHELDKSRREKRELETRVGVAPPSTASRLVDELRKELAEARYEHLAEAKNLKEKLAWYAENQSIISENDALIQEQKELIAKLRGESHGPKRRGKSLLSDVKRIRGLEQQVKDLEEALRKRNPDSLSNLIRAAGPSSEEQKKRKLLEARVKSLEEELKERLEASARRTRAMRQEHEKVKLHYEQMLAAKEESGVHPKGSANANRQFTRARIVALEEELDRVRNFYRQKLEGLSKRQAQAGRPVSVSDAKSQREVDRFRAKATALEVKVEELENELQHVRKGQPVKAQPKGTTVEKTDESTEADADKGRGEEDSIVKALEIKLVHKDEAITKLRRQVEQLSRSSTAGKENDSINVPSNRSLQTFLEEKIRESDRYRSMHEKLEKEAERLKMENKHMEAELKELRLAKIHVNPGMLQHQSLLHRIEEMELRHSNRQRELEVIIEQLKQKAELDMQLLNSKHENELLRKDSQIQEFQAELNAIIDKLQLLPR